MDLFIKHYVLRAIEGAVSALRAELGQLSQRIAEIDGVVGADLWQDEADANRFIFIERWQSAAHYAEGSQLIDKAAFKAVLAHLGAPPEVATLKALCAAGV
jgi:quinol monooxygenase YgiN